MTTDTAKTTEQPDLKELNLALAKDLERLAGMCREMGLGSDTNRNNIGPLTSSILRQLIMAGWCFR